MSKTPISPQRRRMIEDMNVRRFGEKTQNDYIRHVKTFSTYLGRSPATATAEDLRQYQVHQSQERVPPATINSSVAALRFFFRVTLNHPEMGRHLTLVPLPQRLRIVAQRGGGGAASRAVQKFAPRLGKSNEPEIPVYFKPATATPATGAKRSRLATWWLGYIRQYKAPG